MAEEGAKIRVTGLVVFDRREEGGRLAAICDADLGDGVTVRGIRVFRRPGGGFILRMPVRRTRRGEEDVVLLSAGRMRELAAAVKHTLRTGAQRSYASEDVDNRA